MAEKMFYVQDARPGVDVGNCMLFWCPDRKGYTIELNKAGLYTKAEVETMRKYDIGWPKEFIESHTAMHVRRDNVRQEPPVKTIKGKWS